MDIAQLTTFFGWMLVINIVIYAVSAGFVVLARDFVTNLQVRVTGVSGRGMAAAVDGLSKPVQAFGYCV